MSLLLQRKKETSIPPLEGGTYMAVCVGVIDIGTQYYERFKKSSPKVILIFEIPSERIEVDGESKPRWISGTYTQSMNSKSKLTELLTVWRGKVFNDVELEIGFDLTQQLGQPAMVQVTQSEKDGVVYSNLSGVSGIPKGMPAPTAEGELLLYDIGAPDEEVFGKLPEWIRKKIEASEEWQAAHIGTEELDIDMETGEVSDMEVPF
ncbi:MAG: hypothetical protein E7638_04710 [Ruminococcaceae bacterium]|nr:hypothetical protein [Oscillospiraceae bacterium]